MPVGAEVVTWQRTAKKEFSSCFHTFFGRMFTAFTISQSCNATEKIFNEDEAPLGVATAQVRLPYTGALPTIDDGGYGHSKCQRLKMLCQVRMVTEIDLRFKWR